MIQFTAIAFGIKVDFPGLSIDFVNSVAFHFKFSTFLDQRFCLEVDFPFPQDS
jgi:hypothetical protein